MADKTTPSKRDFHLHIEGEIGRSPGLSIAEIKETLSIFPENTGRVVVFINSMGGNVDAALAIHSMLRNCGHPIRIVIGAMAYGAASLVAMAGDEIIMDVNSVMSIRNPEMGISGGVREFEEAIEYLHKVADQAAEIYANRTGKSVDELLALMSDVTWFMGPYALKEGFCTQLTEQGDL